MKNLFLMLPVLGLLHTTVSIHAQALTFDEPSWFAEANTEYAEWLNFTTAVGAPGNAPDVDGGTGDGVLTQTVEGAIVTSTMNIYNPAGASVFEITDSADAPLQTVVFQTWTTGTELDYDSLILQYDDGGPQTLTASREELGRVSGGFGDEVVSKWTWDLSGLDVQAFTIRVAAAAAHTSLVAARLDTRLQSSSGEVIQLSKDSPDLDRWNYPFNATPGTRGAAPIFQAGSGPGIDRHGTYVIGFDTGDRVTSGASADAYIIESARLIATTTTNFEVAYDPTIDSVFTYLPEEHEQYVADEDAGRPVELFGAGFRNGFDVLTWKETTPFAPEGGERSVFPASLNEGGDIIDVTEAVNYAEPEESSPFAIGTFDSVTPGDLVPHETAMTFELNVSDPAVQSYLQMSLSTGRVFFTVTGLPEGVQGAATRTYPEFATRDNLLSDPPRLEMSVRLVETPTVFEIASLAFDEQGRAIIDFTAEEATAYRIRYTSDFNDWQIVENPALTFPEPGVAQWMDENPAGNARFYQIILD